MTMTVIEFGTAGADVQRQVYTLVTVVGWMRERMILIQLGLVYSSRCYTMAAVFGVS